MNEDDFTPIEINVEELAATLSNTELTELAFHDDISEQAHVAILRSAIKRISDPAQLTEWLLLLASNVLRNHSSEILKSSNAVNGEQVSLPAIGAAAVSLINNTLICYCGEGDSGGIMPIGMAIERIMEEPSDLPNNLLNTLNTKDGDPSVLLSAIAVAWDAARKHRNATTLGMMMFSFQPSSEDTQLIEEVKLLELGDDPSEDKAFTAAGVLAVKGSINLEVFSVSTQPAEGSSDPYNRIVARSVSQVRYNRELSRFEEADITDEVGDDLSSITPFLRAAFMQEMVADEENDDELESEGVTKGSIKA